MDKGRTSGRTHARVLVISTVVFCLVALQLLYQSRSSINIFFVQHAEEWEFRPSSSQQPIYLSEEDSTTTLSPSPSPHQNTEFHWEDLNLNSSGVCGWNKCFFQSARDSGIGYLVGSTRAKIDSEPLFESCQKHFE